ncbi:glucose PTS transporter subunit EIIB, partial [Klebsiella pneumoniae]
FTFAIRRWNLLTPGCEVEESTVAQENEQNDLVSGIILAYGGLGNMTRIEACMSRLRIDVTDKSLVDKALLKQLGAAGV